jgi:hypothetical protein
MSFKVISQKGCNALKNKRLDGLYKMSKYQWQGTLNDGELFILIEYKLGAVQVDLQDLEIYLKKGLKTIAISLEKDNNIYDICDFLKLKYKHENIVD